MKFSMATLEICKRNGFLTKLCHQSINVCTIIVPITTEMRTLVNNSNSSSYLLLAQDK